MDNSELDRKAEKQPINYRIYAKAMIERMDKTAPYWRLDTPSLENVLTAMCETVAIGGLESKGE